MFGQEMRAWLVTSLWLPAPFPYNAKTWSVRHKIRNRNGFVDLRTGFDPDSQNPSGALEAERVQNWIWRPVHSYAFQFGHVFLDLNGI